MNRESQTAALREHLNDGLSITSKEAFELYGITRLAGLVWALKKQGYNIATTIITVPTRYGKDARVAEYRLEAAE